MMTPANKPNYLLRAVLALVGSVIIYLGLNVGLGGIKTLGWQGGGAEFMTITDAPTFGIRDNHIRFIGGIWSCPAQLLAPWKTAATAGLNVAQTGCGHPVTNALSAAVNWF